MTVKHMRIFMEVYQAQNITKAAEKLHLTQPAVSRAIQEMEKYYGVRLFERINRKLYITETGHQLYPKALHLVALFDNMEKGLRDWDELGVLRIGATITLGNYLLPRLVCYFHRKHPKVRVQVRVASGGRIQQGLIDNELDLALVEGGIETPHLHSEAFCSDRLQLILPPDDPLLGYAAIHMSDLVKKDLLLREPGSVGRSFLDGVFTSHGLTITPAWESASTQALVRAVSMGLGISILPEQLVMEVVRNGTVATRSVVNEDFERTHYLVWHENKYLTHSAKDFLIIAKRFCSEESF